MDRILTQFVESKYFLKIIETYNPLAVFVTGSRSAGINNALSDYDICVLVPPHTGGESSNPENFLQFIHKETGFCVHYFIRELNEFFINTEQGRTVTKQGANLWKAVIEFGFGGEVLFLQKEFEESWALMTGNRITITKANLYDFYKQNNYGAFMMETAMLGELHPHRDIVYLLLEAYLIADEQPSSETLARFKEIRNMTQQEIADNLPKEEKELYVARIQTLVRTFIREWATFESYLDAADDIYNQIGLC